MDYWPEEGGTAATRGGVEVEGENSAKEMGFELDFRVGESPGGSYWVLFALGFLRSIKHKK